MKELGIAVDSLFVNRVLLETGVLLQTAAALPARATGSWRHCSHCSRNMASHRLYLVRDFPAEIAGAAKLKKFTGELWQIQTEK